MKVLFVCSQNMLRSPTGEEVFRGYPGVETSSAGIDVDAVRPVTAEIVAWADVIFAMETHHEKRLRERFALMLETKPLIVLRIRDDFPRMDAKLVAILKERVPPYLEAEKARLGEAG